LKNTKISIFGGISKFHLWVDFGKLWQFWADFPTFTATYFLCFFPCRSSDCQPCSKPKILAFLVYLRTEFDLKNSYFLAICTRDENNVLALRTVTKHIPKKIRLYFLKIRSHIWLSAFVFKTKLGDMTTCKTKLNQSPTNTHKG
jgi:hypothetical protein